MTTWKNVQQHEPPFNQYFLVRPTSATQALELLPRVAVRTEGGLRMSWPAFGEAHAYLRGVFADWEEINTWEWTEIPK